MTNALKEFAEIQSSSKRLEYSSLITHSLFCEEIKRIAETIDSENPRQILWHILQNTLKIPRCMLCFNPAKWNSDKRSYRLFCGSSCAAKHSSISRRKKCLEKFGVSHHTRLQTCQEKRKKTCRKKYGVDFTLQSPKIRKQIKNTCIEKYGGPAPASDKIVREKMAATSSQKYGVPIATMLPEIHEKISKTCLAKYGVDNALKNPIFQEKIRQTNLERYQRISASQNHLSLETCKIISDPLLLEEYLHNKSVISAAKELGMGYSSLYQIVARFGLSVVNKGLGISSGQSELADWLHSEGHIFMKATRKIIRPYELDFFFPKYNIAIEYNGDYWHMNPKYYTKNDIQKVTERTAEQVWIKDAQKQKLCQDKNILLFTVWETEWHENKQQIQNTLQYLFQNCVVYL